MTPSLEREAWHTSVNLSKSVFGEPLPLNDHARQTCAYFGSLFIGSDIDGRQMRGKGTFFDIILCINVLKLLLRTKIPALGSFDPPINTGCPQGSLTYLLWMSPNTLGEAVAYSMLL